MVLLRCYLNLKSYKPMTRLVSMSSPNDLMPKLGTDILLCMLPPKWFCFAVAVDLFTHFFTGIITFWFPRCNGLTQTIYTYRMLFCNNLDTFWEDNAISRMNKRHTKPSLSTEWNTRQAFLGFQIFFSFPEIYMYSNELNIHPFSGCLMVF